MYSSPSPFNRSVCFRLPIAICAKINELSAKYKVPQSEVGRVLLGSVFKDIELNDKSKEWCFDEFKKISAIKKVSGYIYAPVTIDELIEKSNQFIKKSQNNPIVKDNAIK